MTLKTSLMLSDFIDAIRPNSNTSLTLPDFEDFIDADRLETNLSSSDDLPEKC